MVMVYINKMIILFFKENLKMDILKKMVLLLLMIIDIKLKLINYR